MSVLDAMLASANKRLAIDAQLADIGVRAANVKGYREYYDGDHQIQLTADQKSMLRILDRGFGNQGFISNYMDRVVDTKADRLVLERIETDVEAATTKLAELVNLVKLDRLNNQVNRHTIRDGDNFVMVSFDNAKKTPVLTEELAYDGDTGVIPIYKSEVDPIPYAVIKIWQEYNLQPNNRNEDTYTPYTRLNIYYADRIEKFISRNSVSAEKFYDTEADQVSGVWPVKWVDPATGEALGIPLHHFRWNSEKNYGKSELDDVISTQDALNRVLNSLVMASELTAFRILVALGFNPPAEMTPGGWIVAGEDGLTKEDVVSVDQLEAGDLSQLISSATFLKREIHDSTNTPNPGDVGQDASGEARKQFESFLVGQLESHQKSAGETWEAVFEQLIKVWKAFGGVLVPEYKRLTVRWKPVAVRDDAVLMANAGLVRPDISRKAYLETVAPVFDWNTERIDTIMTEKDADDKKQMEQMRASLPDFGTGNNVNDIPTDSGSSNS